MGEVRKAQQWLFEPEFNRAIKVCTTDERITSDAGLLLVREADHRLGLTEHLAGQLIDPRRPDKIRYELVELLRERVYALALGYSTQDDADRLAHDPAMKLAAWNRHGEAAIEERLASQPTQSRLLDTLAHHAPNRAALRDALAECCTRHLRASGGDRAARRITLDIDSFPIQVHSRQPGAAYNGHYRDTVYHPLVASYSVAGEYDSFQDGHRLGNGFVHAILRQGQVHTAQGVLRFLDETLRLAAPLGYVIDLRIDAGYVQGEVLDWLTERNVRFLGRIKANPVQVWFHGQPLPETRVSFIPRGAQLRESFDDRFERNSDSQGVASFEPREANVHLIVAHHADPTRAGEGYRGTKYSATLTITVPQLCPCCQTLEGESARRGLTLPNQRPSPRPDRRQAG